MNTMIAWFPIAKFIFGVMAMGLIWWLMKKGFKKIAYSLIIFVGIVLWFAPVKIDGTKTETHHKNQVKQVTVKYNDVERNKQIITTKKKTLEEVLREENARSLQANKVIEQEINK